MSLSVSFGQRLTEDVLQSCLKSDDYMQIKNALLLLNRCAKVGLVVMYSILMH